MPTHTMVRINFSQNLANFILVQDHPQPPKWRPQFWEDSKTLPISSKNANVNTTYLTYIFVKLILQQTYVLNLLAGSMHIYHNGYNFLFHQHDIFHIHYNETVLLYNRHHTIDILSSSISQMSDHTGSSCLIKKIIIKSQRGKILWRW